MEAFNRTLYAAMAVDHPGPLALAVLPALARWPLNGVPVLLVGLWLLGGPQDRSAAVFAALSASLALSIAFGASRFIDHPRPFMLGLAPNRLDHAADSSFPSDHATLFFALSIAFMARPSRSMPRLWAPLVLVGVGLAWARVALGIHFPLDIAGAALIAMASVALMMATPLRPAGVYIMAFAEAIRRRVPFLGCDELEGRDARPPD